MGAGRKLQVARAVNAWRDGERGARAGGFVDGALQRAALVVGAARAQAELAGVNAKRGNWRRSRRRCPSRRNGDAGASGRGGQGEEMATIEVHGTRSNTGYPFQT